MSVRGASPPSSLPSARLPKALGRMSDADASAREATRADVRAKAEDAHEALESNHAFTSDPGPVEVNVGAPDASVDMGGRDIGASYTAVNGATSLDVSGGISTGSGWASVSASSGDGSRSIGASLAKGWLGGSASIAWATPEGGAREVSGGAAWYPGGIALDVGVARTSEDGRTVSFGAMAFLDADREIEDLGPAPGTDGKRRIELRRSTGTSGTLTPGVASALIGVGGRIGAGKERAVIYRTTVDDERARALLFEQKGVLGWLRDKARAIAPGRDPVVIPDLRDPATLADGDELVTTVSGSFGMGLFIGGLPLRLGAHGVMKGDFHLGVKRLDEHRLEVVVTPTNIKAIQGRVGAPWLLEGDLSRSLSGALTQGFVFDLREPDARAAYARVLDGELPGGLPNKVKGRRREAAELVNALSAETLPAGVQRSFVDQVELKRSQVGVSTTFALWFKGGSFAGLGAQGVKLDEKRVQLDRHGVVSTDTRGSERRRQVLLSGEETRGVYASIARSTRYDDEGKASEELSGLTLTLKLSDSKLWGSELDDEMIRTLNERFGLSLPNSERDGRRKSRALTVSRRLDAKDLDRLVTLASHSEELADLQRLFHGKESDHARALAVQTFLAEGGVDAMGAVVKALGGGKAALVLDNSAEAYEGPLEKAREQALRYPEPISPRDDNDALAERYQRGDKALREAELGLEDLAHDPLLGSDEQRSLRAALVEAKRSVERTLSTAHLAPEERASLIARLEQGWTSSDEQRVLDALER